MAADGHGPSGDVPRGAHRHGRVPLRRSSNAAAPRAVRRSLRGGRAHAGPVRQGELLRRGHGPRQRHRKARAQRASRPRPKDRRPSARDERLALRRGRRRAHPGRDAVHQLRFDAPRPGPFHLRRHGLPLAHLRGNARTFRRPSRGVREHPARRRTLQRLLHHGRRGRELHAGLSRPRRRGHHLVVRQGGRSRPARALRREDSGRRARARRLRGERHLADGLSRVLPRRLRLHPVGQAQRDQSGAWTRLRCRVDGGLRPADH